VVYTRVNGASHIEICKNYLGDVLVGNHLFVIFAVFDVSCAVNSCINHSFFYIYLLYEGRRVSLFVVGLFVR